MQICENITTSRMIMKYHRMLVSMLSPQSKHINIYKSISASQWQYVPVHDEVDLGGGRQQWTTVGKNGQRWDTMDNNG